MVKTWHFNVKQLAPPSLTLCGYLTVSNARNFTHNFAEILVLFLLMIQTYIFQLRNNSLFIFFLRFRNNTTFKPFTNTREWQSFNFECARKRFRFLPVHTYKRGRHCVRRGFLGCIRWVCRLLKFLLSHMYASRWASCFFLYG